MGTEVQANMQPEVQPEARAEVVRKLSATTVYYNKCQEEAEEKPFLWEVIPSTGQTVGQMTAHLVRDSAWVSRAFPKDSMPSEALLVARVGRALYDQCVVLDVPFYLFKEGAFFFQGMNVKYFGIWAISAMRQQAIKRGLPIIQNNFKIMYDIPRIEDILSKQEDYLKDIESGNHANYASMSLAEVSGVQEKGFFRFPRNQRVIYGAEVSCFVDGDKLDPVYFGVDFSKTTLKAAYGSYQQQVVRTKAYRHAMQTFYGPLLPIQTTDETSDGDAGSNETVEDAMKHYELIDQLKAQRKAEILGGGIA